MDNPKTKQDIINQLLIACSEKADVQTMKSLLKQTNRDYVSDTDQFIDESVKAGVDIHACIKEMITDFPAFMRSETRVMHEFIYHGRQDYAEITIKHFPIVKAFNSEKFKEYGLIDWRSECLREACLRGNAQFVKKLLQDYKTPIRSDKYFSSPLERATWVRSIDTIKVLIKHAYEIGEPYTKDEIEKINDPVVSDDVLEYWKSFSSGAMTKSAQLT